MQRGSGRSHRCEREGSAAWSCSPTPRAMPGTKRRRGPPRRCVRRGDRQTASCHQPRARRVRTQGPYDRAEPAARGGPDLMSGRDNRALLDSLRRPDGWFTIGLVLLVCATLAWSLDDALLVLGQDQLTDFLFWAAMGGAA